MRFVCILTTILLTAITAAHADISDSCVSLGESRKVSSMCDFKQGVPTYYTPVRTLPIEGCPKEIVVQYTDPSTNKVTDWVATRSGTTIETCGSGVSQVRVKPDSSSARHAPSSSPSLPSRTVYWNAVAGGIWKINGVVQVAIGYSGSRRSAAEARTTAVEQCQQAGGQNCEASQAFSSGCFYAATWRNSDGAGWVSRATKADATAACNAKGTCKGVIGGCVD